MAVDRIVCFHWRRRAWTWCLLVPRPPPAVPTVDCRSETCAGTSSCRGIFSDAGAPALLVARLAPSFQGCVAGFPSFVGCLLL
ncbi:hypothetical protein BKA56DRAFT_589065 [Ilyonectria sp. MPI-CAGE-AT-0026]|nr:hypothetical protein BKA56DRAFT_589065 [Ilyonectria sp. MPI-CAGE-AT-0026]